MSEQPESSNRFKRISQTIVDKMKTPPRSRRPSQVASPSNTGTVSGTVSPTPSSRWKRISQTITSPFSTFEPPSSRRQSLASTAQDEHSDQQSNLLIAQCVEWRRVYMAYEPPKIGKDRSKDIEADREVIIAKVNRHAVALSRRHQPAQAIDLAEQARRNLMTEGYRPTKAAQHLQQLWVKPSGTPREQIQDLKDVRAEMAVLYILSRFVHENELGMINAHRAVFERLDELEFCILVREHSDRMGDRRKYRIPRLAEEDADKFASDLEVYWLHHAHLKPLSGEEETSLVRAFKSFVPAREGPPLTTQEQLANQGRYHNACMLLMIKAGIVHRISQELGMTSAADAVSRIIASFMVRLQSSIDATEIMKTARQWFEQHLETNYDDRDIWPGFEGGAW